MRAKRFMRSPKAARVDLQGLWQYARQVAGWRHDGKTLELRSWNTRTQRCARDLLRSVEGGEIDTTLAVGARMKLSMLLSAARS